ncbi:MAG TPA: ATP-binding cassette domain-containing protein, partial [Nocardioides sp.]|nr:ATP-binding cassette domain-containing protein [Nocardioides sp.]
MITAQRLEVRAGARLLMDNVSFRVAAGDKVGLVGRNGAGKTTLTRILAGEGLPASGTVLTTGEVGYLPQDPRTGDLDVPARERILSARGLDDVVRRLRAAEGEMGSTDEAVQQRAMRRYSQADAELHAGGGYAAESEAAQIAHSLGIEDRLLHQPLRTLSGGQRRRVELARILFSGADTLLLDEPTNHLDADSIVWLRDFLKAHRGGLVVISHDNALLEATVNRVLHLDANRAEVDVYNMGWKAYLQQRETDEKRRKRERVNAENKA